MKKIGEGYYYNVYDLGNGRVLKKQKSKLRLFLYILSLNSISRNFFKECKNALATIREMETIYKRINEKVIDKALIGNPIFLDSINYEQEKVIVFKELLTEYDEEELKQFLEMYIILIKKFWSYGVDERVYNFTINTGVNAKGELVMIDFNEVSFDIEEIKSRLEKQIWTRRWSYGHLSPTLKEYYKKRMSEEITPEKLQELWKK